MKSPLVKIDPKLDLVLEREIDVPVALVWDAWTTPESIKQWFCPKPWMVTACEIDLRPGGVFSTVMRSPTGEEFPSAGCYLDVVTHQRLIWTDALLPGFRPAPKAFFTGALYLEPIATGTRYTAIAVHGDEAARASHEEMGFYHGWATALDQLVAHIKSSRH